VEITDRQLLNESVTTGEEIVARVDLVNFHPARGRTTLNLTAGGTLVAQRTVTLDVDERRTVYLRTVPDFSGEYELHVDGISAGTVTVTAADESPSTSTDPPTGTSSETADPTTAETATTSETPVGASGTAATASAGTGTEASPAGAGDPDGTETVIATGMSLLLLYGVGVAVYVVRKEPPGGLG
jgi:hypothetical protein